MVLAVRKLLSTQTVHYKVCVLRFRKRQQSLWMDWDASPSARVGLTPVGLFRFSIKNLQWLGAYGAFLRFTRSNCGLNLDMENKGTTGGSYSLVRARIQHDFQVIHLVLGFAIY